MIFNFTAMKKIILAFIILISTGTTSKAQRFAYIDTDYILENVEEYAEAQKELDALSEQWQKTIEAKYAELEELRKTLKAEQILLTDEMRNKKQQEIDTKEKEARAYQKQKFGLEGELFNKRKELVKPIQDKVFKEIKEMADRNNYAIIFDAAGQTNILYSDPKYDKSEEVLRKLK